MAAGAEQQKEGRGTVPELVEFLEDTWEERKLIEWPAAETVKQATWVVVVFIAICTTLLGTADFIFSRLLGWLIR
ncbi:MAG: preprotein translocase subunit SecE [Deltaproteobacteria bacterium]|nr:preprotein translocase subunit SecE [Deltaproteobacteria bacterium]